MSSPSDVLEIALTDSNHDVDALISELHNQHDFCASVQCACVAVQTPAVSGPGMIRLSTALGLQLPMLKNLLISSSILGMYNFPVAALCSLTQHARSLEVLRLRIITLSPPPYSPEIEPRNGTQDRSGNVRPNQDAAEGLRHHPSLKNFRLESCQLAEPDETDDFAVNLDHSLDQLSRALVTMPRLECVALTAAHRGALGQISPPALAALIALPTLKELGVRQFCLTSVHIVAAARAIAASTTLKAVVLGTSETLHGNDNPADEALAQMLRQTTSLKRLVFQMDFHQNARNNDTNDDDDGNNSTSDDSPTNYESSLVQMAQALHTNTTLEDVCLWGSMTSDSHAAFVNALKHNFFLTSFWMDQAGENDQSNIALYLSLNQDGMRQRLLNEDTVTPRRHWLRELLARQNSLDATYYLIRVIPSFLEEG